MMLFILCAATVLLFLYILIKSYPHNAHQILTKITQREEITPSATTGYVLTRNNEVRINLTNTFCHYPGKQEYFPVDLQEFSIKIKAESMGFDLIYTIQRSLSHNKIRRLHLFHGKEGLANNKHVEDLLYIELLEHSKKSLENGTAFDNIDLQFFDIKNVEKIITQ